jgi:hypothetical protein
MGQRNSRRGKPWPWPASLAFRPSLGGRATGEPARDYRTGWCPRTRRSGRSASRRMAYGRRDAVCRRACISCRCQRGWSTVLYAAFGFLRRIHVQRRRLQSCTVEPGMKPTLCQSNPSGKRASRYRPVSASTWVTLRAACVMMRLLSARFRDSRDAFIWEHWQPNADVGALQSNTIWRGEREPGELQFVTPSRLPP